MGKTVVIRGAGDLASGVAHRLFRSGIKVVMLEQEQPTVIRRTVAFATAVWEGSFSVEGVEAQRASEYREIEQILAAGKIAVVVDPEGKTIPALQPDGLVDAILAKKNLGTCIDAAPVVIGLGPGFTAGIDVHAVVETNRGHYLGRVILSGQAQPDTGVPGEVAGYTVERLIRASADGIFEAEKEIGEPVRAGERVARVNGVPVIAAVDGVIRGLLKSGIRVTRGMKAGDVDPRGNRDHCFTISEKARAIGGGVLEALLYFWHRRGELWT